MDDTVSQHSHRSAKSATSTSSRGSRASQGHRQRDDMDKHILEELEDWQELWRQKKVDEKQQKEDSDRDKDNRRRQREQKQKQKELNELRERLLEASEKRDAAKLRKTISDVEKQDHVSELRDVYDSAVELLRSIDSIENMQKAKDKLDHNTVVEIRSLNNMAEVVHQVVLATFIMLGYDGHSEPKLKSLRSSWKECQSQCVVSGEMALHKRIKDLDSASLQSKTVCDVLTMLDKYERDFVSKVSGAAGLLYDWSMGMCEEKLLTDEKTAKKRNKKKEEKKDEDSDDDENKREEKMKRCEHCQIKRQEQN